MHIVIEKKWESHVFTQIFVFLVAKYTNKDEFKTTSQLIHSLL